MSAEAGASRVRGGPLNLEVRAAREDLPAINDLYNRYVVNTAITFHIAQAIRAARERRTTLDGGFR
jgi:hypothetical protein